MQKKVLAILTGLFVGVSIAYLVLIYITSSNENPKLLSPISLLIPQKQIIGFLPYWLLNKAQKDYAPYITTLTYFGLQIGADGSLQKLSNPQELEPGWNALQSGKVTPFLQTARQHNITLSLLIDSGDADTIDAFVAHPVQSAQNLVKDVTPILHTYGFSDINLDIEDTRTASQEARVHFSQFVSEIREELPSAITLTVEVTATDAIKKNLIDVQKIGSIADAIVIMAYDYHYPGSFVTGPIAPLTGGGALFEFDVTQAVTQAEKIVPNTKLILGIPLYGYEWETLTNTSHAATIPHTGITASTKRVDELLATCATCSAQTDDLALEKYIIYQDNQTQTYHQIFYPDASATAAKIDFVTTQHMGGLALWALGYEDNEIMQPLIRYKQ